MLTYVWPVRVYYEDTDHGGVVYYANYLKFMERCRTEMLRAIGVEQNQLIDDQDLIFAVRHVAVNYIAPAKFNDQLLVVAQLVQASKVRLQFKQAVFCSSDVGAVNSGEFVSAEKLKNNEATPLLCEAEISIVSLSASQLRPKRMPKALFEELLCER